MPAFCSNGLGEGFEMPGWLDVRRIVALAKQSAVKNQLLYSAILPRLSLHLPYHQPDPSI